MNPARVDGTLDGLLEFIKETRGFDFTGYKRASIQRRVAKRMGAVAVESYEDYLDYLQLHGDEFAELFNTLLINVTGFFRDPSTWDYVAGTIVPQLLASRPAGSPIRVWCAGCASGEEPYTVAMVFARVMGDAEFRERVKIYATDVDEPALEQARSGAYEPRQVEDVPHDALERFFDRNDQRYSFRKDLRRSVIFGRNDLVQDAPISRIDLLVCRNTLMYFTADTQAQILRRFHFALNDAGVLLLGKSEMLITHTDLFLPLELRWRAFRKVAPPPRRERLRGLGRELGTGTLLSVPETLRDAAFEVTAEPQIVLDAAGTLILANGAARWMFDLSVGDVGHPIQDFELSYRPVELRGQLDALAKDRRPIDLRSVPWRGNGQEVLLDVRIAPLLRDDELVGTSVTYSNVTQARRLEEQLASSKRELEQAYEDLQSTVEELETTNEELQSTNEELETTNEELQSTNEELETMNEELQSSNEELETMNDELRHRTDELNDVNVFLETILTTMGLAVVVVDRDQHVQIWNTQARELWGLTSGEAEGQHLLSLDAGLPVERLKREVRAVLTAESEREEVILPATNRRGRAFDCRVTVLPLGRDREGISGAILIMEPVSG